MPTPQVADALHARGADCWRRWDTRGLDDACVAAAQGQTDESPTLAYWRGLAALMAERTGALDAIARAHAGYLACGDARSAAVACHTALAMALLDTGAMDRSADWLTCAQAIDEQALEASSLTGLNLFWWRLGWLARTAFGAEAGTQASAAASCVMAELQSRQATLSPDERLIAARMLVDYHFAGQRYAQFELLANLVESPPLFDAAAPITRARWAYALGYAHYQIGALDQAERQWQRGLDLAAQAGLSHTRLLLSLALVRLRVDRGRIAEAAAVLAEIQPRWGLGRMTQLIVLQQMRARVELLSGQAHRAATTLDDALQLAEQAGLPASELASCLTDKVQVLIALERSPEATVLLRHLASTHTGRDAQVFDCLAALWSVWCRRGDGAAAVQLRHELTAALRLAQALRYTMFFRLLPALAAGLCKLALRWDVEARFAREVVNARSLPAPTDADACWPWPCWLRMLGGFELVIHGKPWQSPGKTQQKPLELLRLLACERGLAIGMVAAAAMLWPEGESLAGRKNLEITVQRLRKLLGDDTLVRVGDGRVGLDTARVGCDLRHRRRAIERLEALVIAFNAAQDATAPRAECLALIAELRELGVDLLPGAPDALWLEAARRQAAQDTVRAALASATLLDGQGAVPAEQSLLCQALTLEPLAEALVARLMQSHARAGQRAQALHVYERYAQRLAAEGMTPNPVTQRLWRSLISAQ